MTMGMLFAVRPSRVRLTLCAVALVPTFAAVADDASRRESLRDRVVTSSDYEDFRRATSVPAVSPALDEAGGGDLVVRSTGLRDPASMTTVVLKPRPGGPEYVVPDPPQGNAYGFLDEHLRAAARAGAGVVRFPAGRTLRVTPPSGRAHLTVRGFRDAVIDLNGSTLELGAVERGVQLVDNRRVALRNGRVRNPSVVLSTIARVVPDSGRAGVRFEVLPEYRSVLEGSGNRDSLFTVGSAERGPDGEWRLRAANFDEAFVNRGSTNRFAYRDGSYVSTSAFRGDVSQLLAAGHVWLQHENNDGHGIVVQGDTAPPNTDITLEDLVLENIPGMGIFGEVSRGLHVNRVSYRRGSRSAIFANASDGIHINANGGDIVIENSDIGAGPDDRVNIKGNWWAVARIDTRARTLTLEPVDRKQNVRRWGFSGQRVVFIDGDFGVLGEARLVADSTGKSDRHVVRLDRLPGGLRKGSIIGNVDNGSGRVVVRDNRFGDTRSQGVLVQTSHVVVSGNRFDGVAGPAIKLNVALEDWYEGIAVSNVLVSDNRFARSSAAADKPNELIHFEQTNRADREVDIIDDVVIRGNRAVGTDAEPSALPTPDPSPIPEPAPEPTPDPAPEPAPGPMPTPGTDALELVYENKAPRVRSPEIEAQVTLRNTGTSNVNLHDAEVRYRFDPDGLVPEVRVKASKPDGGISPGWTSADGPTYAVFRVTRDLVLEPGAAWKLRFKIEARGGGEFDQGNDTSFIASRTSGGPNADIVVYRYP